MCRISALLYRHLVPTFRDPMRISDMIYWPLVDMVLMGFLALWAQEGRAHSNDFILSLLTCVICWYLIQRSALEISRNLLIEIWENNLGNLLASPLSFFELCASLMTVGFIQALITFFYSMFIVWFIFSQNIFSIFIWLLPFVPLFIVSGWIIGFLTSSIIFYFGKTADTLAWALPWFFAIMSGVYYPLKLFPVWLQKISYLFPASYLFEGIRYMILEKSFPTANLIISFFLSLLYLFLAFLLLWWSFNAAKKRGLSTLS